MVSAKSLLAVVSTVLFACCALPASAANWNPHVAVGSATSIEQDRAGVASLGIERDWRDRFDGRLSLDLTLYGVEGRDDVSDDLRDDSQILAFGLRWRRDGWLLGFAPALATSRTAAISSTVQFVSTAGYQWRRCAVLLQHISNGSTHGRNIGETMLMLELALGAHP